MRTIKSIILSVFLLAAGIMPAAAQKYTVSGYVTDAASGEPLIGVAVMDKATSSGSVTGNSGFYSLTLAAGEKELIVSYLGYEEKTEKVNLVSNITLNIAIEQSNAFLEGAVVTARRVELGALGTQMSAIDVPLAQIKTIPALGGEVDVIKALQLLPGVQSGSEGSAGIYVRGGGADENLLLMDGVPLYNVNHLFGFFSVFNADAVKNVTLYKGSFPARFGGHLSSVIDVRMNDGNDSEYHGNISIGLISSKFNVEGPIVKGRTTFNISARRTYLDLLAKPLIMGVNKDSYENKDDYEKVDGGYDFYDLNLKITHKLLNNDRISFSFYSGDDNAHVGLESSDKYEMMYYDPETGDRTPTGIYNKSKDGYSFGWRWGNMVSSLRWNHTVTPTLYLSSSLSYTKYKSDLGVGMYGYSSVIEGDREYGKVEMQADMNYLSDINDVAAAFDFDWHPNPEHDVKFGTSFTAHSFKPGVITMMMKSTDSDDPNLNEDFNRKVGDDSMASKEASLFGEDNWSITPWLKANIGFHASLYSVSGKTYLSPEPRLSARALISDGFSFKASYSEMSQYIHLLCNSNLSMPSDLWVPVTKNIKPMRSRQTAAGFFYEYDAFDFSVEGYYKTMDNVLEYKDGASYMGMSSGWEEKVCMGRGWSYGAEFLAQKKTGKTTGWIGYTISKSMRQFDTPGMMINDGNPFPAKYDRRHDLSATVTHAFSKRFDVSATFVYASGNCGSIPYEDFVSIDFDGQGGVSGGHSVSYLPNRNNYRMPAYNRMDVGMNYYKEKKRGQAVWNLSVYNVYNRQNPFIVMQGRHDEYDPATGNWTGWPVLKQLSIFPVIPTISYTFKF